MTDLLNWALEQPWFLWAILLIIFFPLLIVALGEWITRLELARSAWAGPLKNLRHLVLPQLVFLLIMTRVLELPGDSVWVRVVETALWILLLHTALSVVDPLIFGHLGGGGGHWNARIPKLVVDFARAILVMIGASLVLSSVWEVDLGRMLAALGVGSVVLGLALQDTLGALFSGITLLSARQFRTADWLSVGGHEGKIIDMNWRSVTLLTRDEDVIIVPNSDLAKGQFVNYSHPYPRHRERVAFDLSFDDAPYLVKKALGEAALATPGVLADPAPRVILVSYDEFSVKHEVQYFIDNYQEQPRILDSFKSRVWYIAKRYGISFPTRAHEVQLVQPTTDDAASGQAQMIDTILRRQPLLSANPALLEELAAHARLLDYATGERIIVQGNYSRALSLIGDGQAVETYSDSRGQSHQLRQLHANDLFGLNALVRREPHEVTVTCIDDVQVVSISADTAQRLITKSPDIAVQMEQLIDARTRTIAALEREASRSAASVTRGSAE